MIFTVKSSEKEFFNIGWCNCRKKSVIKHLTGLTNSKELKISQSKVIDTDIGSLKGLKMFSILNMEGVSCVCFMHE